MADLFNESWYLSQNPDIKAAVEAGLFSAQEHFENHGKAEGRSPGPLFDPAHYLDQNPDIKAAVEAGLINAYDHFVNYGMSESRSPMSLFNVDFYLEQNPDVKAAVEAGLINAVEHFLSFGQGEPRYIDPFIDLGAYLNANPDVAGASGMSALEHLMQYGVSEGRDLGNGINLGIFADDPKFQEALQSGDIAGAMSRVEEVAPFLPDFEPAPNWEAPADTPIPTDFTPPEGTKLVIPPTVEVPDGTELPDTFDPVEPAPQPEPGGGGGGGGEATTFELTTGEDIFTGTVAKNTFNAKAAGSLQTNDTLTGHSNNGIVNIDAGAIAKGADPIITGVKVINNSHVGAFAAQGGTPVDNAAWLNMSRVTGLEELWTNFKGHGTGTTPNVGVFYGTDAAPITMIEPSPTFGISNTSAQESTGAGFVALSFLGATGTLNLALKDNDAGSYMRAGMADEFENININVLEGNAGVLGLSATAKNIKVTGDGDLAFFQRAFEDLEKFDASEAKGKIQFGGKTGVGAEATQLLLADEFSIKTGLGDDVIDLTGVTNTGTVDLGAGDDFVHFGVGTTVTGGTGDDTFVIKASAETGADQHIHITDYETENDIIDLTQVTNLTSLGQLDIRQGGQEKDGWTIPGGEDDTVIQLSGGGGVQLILENTYERTVKFKIHDKNLSDVLALKGLVHSADSYSTFLVNTAPKKEVVGGDDSEILSGGDGAQTLNGGAGNDILIGGKGNDTFVLDADYGTGARTDENDIIFDFSMGDEIRVEALKEVGKKNETLNKLGDWWLSNDGRLQIVTAVNETVAETISITVLGEYHDLYVELQGGYAVFTGMEMAP